MSETIGQRQLRNDNAEIMRRVAGGERFVVTRNGVPVADLVPHQASSTPATRLTLAQAQRVLRQLPPIDVDRWRADRAKDDEIFGSDDPLDGLR